jgi:transcriptional regulator with XRE-family HTH domain
VKKVFILNEYNKDIGKRIKELRELSDKSIPEFVEDLKIDEDTYEKYENGELDIPASFLYEIAHALNVDLSLLLTGEETRMSIFDVTRANKGIEVERRKQYKYENLCDKFIHKKAEMFIVTVDPNENKKPSLNTHPGQEFNYILEGSLKIYIHNNEIVLNEGDSIFFDSTHRHAMEALNQKKAKFLAVIM